MNANGMTIELQQPAVELEIEHASAAFAPTPEQRDLREAVRGFLGRSAPLATMRELAETESGIDPELARGIATELGLNGVLVPEEHGGVGLSFLEVAIVVEEMGRVLYSNGYLASAVLAVTGIRALGSPEAEKELLPAIASGAMTATVALSEEDGSWDGEGATRAGKGDDGAWRLDGVKSYVVDGANADLVLVPARGEAGLSLFAVERGGPGVTIDALPTLDQTRRLARVTLEDAPARLLGGEGAGEAAVTAIVQAACVALAAEQVGVAQSALDQGVAYAKDRRQFDRPIGSFQMVQQKCADMMLDVESARSAAYYAAWALASGSDEVPVVTSLAKAHCCDAAFAVTAENVQVHGGIGFTWEADAHLFLKRAKSAQLLFGGSDYHRERLAQAVGI